LARRYPRDDRVITSFVISLTGFGQYAEAAAVMERFVAPLMEQAGSEGAARLRSYVDRIRAGSGVDALWDFFRDMEPEGTASAGHQRLFDAIALAGSGDMDGAIRIIEES